MIWKCTACNRQWYYPVDKCIFCNKDLILLTSTSFVVKGYTKVLTPSSEHDNVPYYELLLEDENKNLHTRKSFKPYAIGEHITHNDIKCPTFDVTHNIQIAIIGTGMMGVQLTQFLAQTGYSVTLCGRSYSSLERAICSIKSNLLRSMDTLDQERIIKKIIPTLDLTDLDNASWIIESISENIELKNQLFKELNSICSETAIICTNTSSLPISELASSLSKPERFIGMHFFNPVSKMNLVEVIYGTNTSTQTISNTIDFARNLGKIPILVQDSPGFIVNRMIMPFINEAVCLLSQGVSAEDIDSAIKLGLNHPMGPLALADLIGLDVCVSIMNAIYSRLGEDKYKPSAVLCDMVRKGNLGKKTGKGFYNYSIEIAPVNPLFACKENLQD